MNEFVQGLTFASLVVLLIRLTVPLLIFKWPLVGTIAALLADAFDIYIARFLGGEIPSYLEVDKILDIYYLSFAFIISLSWDNKLAKNTSMVLFFYRILGVFIFEITGVQIVLFFFPNLFEHFFLFYLILGKVRKGKGEWLDNKKKLFLVLFFLLLLKIPQEYLLHFIQVQKPMEYLFPWLPEFFH